MKNICKVFSVAVVLAMILAVGALAAVPAGEYADGLVINDDGTFTMVQAGENMDGEAFELTVSGTVDEDGSFTITSLKDGDLDLIDMASEDQLAGNLEALEAAFAGGASGEASGEASSEASDEAYPYFDEFRDYVAELALADDFMASQDGIPDDIYTAETPYVAPFCDINSVIGAMDYVDWMAANYPGVDFAAE